MPSAPRLRGAAIRRPTGQRRLLVAALLALSALVPAAAAPASTVLAASDSCTGWTSRDVPPETIRVGRNDGSVDVVNFRRYVAVVMAVEWPAWMPRAALEAGATAVKQYGWFYTLAGKHRSSYVNGAGQCFDVRDNTADQLYRPERVGTIADKIWRAVDATLGLSVRRDGKFFLTGYRAGTSGSCGADADGWRLFAKSVMDCAERGWTREQIQRRYYYPNVTFHWADSARTDAGVDTPITPPTARLRVDKTLDDKYARLYWDTAGARPAGTHYQLQRLVSWDWVNVRLPDNRQPWVNLALRFGEGHRFRVRLRNAAGDAGPWYESPLIDARLIQDGAAMTWSPNDWRRVSVDATSGGTTTYTSRDSSEVTFSFTGRSVAVVGAEGSRYGHARIYVDGELADEIDLHAATDRWRVLVFSRSWAQPGAHTIRVVVMGDGRVDVDGIAVFD